MAQTLSEERLMRDRWIWRLTIKSAVSLDVMREGFSAAKALPRQAGNGYDWLIGAVVIVTKLSYVVVWCMDYVPPLGSNASCDDPSSMASSGESREHESRLCRVDVAPLRAVCAGLM